MPRRILPTLLLALPVLPHGTHAQTGTYGTSVEGSGYEDMAVGESRDVPCEYSFSARFHSYYGVEFEGQMFMTQWRSIRSDFPLPAWNWYYERAAHRPIHGVGNARAVIIWLPPQRPRR